MGRFLMVPTGVCFILTAGPLTRNTFMLAEGLFSTWTLSSYGVTAKHFDDKKMQKYEQTKDMANTFALNDRFTYKGKWVLKIIFHKNETNEIKNLANVLK